MSTDHDTTEVLSFFAMADMPPHLAAASEPFRDLAHRMVDEGPDVLMSARGIAADVPGREGEKCRNRLAQAAALVVCGRHEVCGLAPLLDLVLEARDCAVRAAVVSARDGSPAPDPGPLPFIQAAFARWTGEHQRACQSLPGSGTGELQTIMDLLRSGGFQPMPEEQREAAVSRALAAKDAEDETPIHDGFTYGGPFDCSPSCEACALDEQEQPACPLGRCDGSGWHARHPWTCTPRDVQPDGPEPCECGAADDEARGLGWDVTRRRAESAGFREVNGVWHPPKGDRWHVPEASAFADALEDTQPPVVMSRTVTPIPADLHAGSAVVLHGDWIKRNSTDAVLVPDGNGPVRVEVRPGQQWSVTGAITIPVGCTKGDAPTMDPNPVHFATVSTGGPARTEPVRPDRAEAAQRAIATKCAKIQE